MSSYRFAIIALKLYISKNNRIISRMFGCLLGHAYILLVD